MFKTAFIFTDKFSIYGNDVGYLPVQSSSWSGSCSPVLLPFSGQWSLARPSERDDIYI